MSDGDTSYENRFMEWLSAQVTPAQLSSFYMAFTDINRFCLTKKLLSKPLFETDDLATLSNVRKTVESNKVFAFNFRKQKNTMITAIRHYCRFIKEKDQGGSIEPEPASQNSTNNTKSDAPVDSGMATVSEKTNRLKFIEWLDTRGISSGNVFVVLSSLKRCTDRVKAERIIDDDIYHVISSDVMESVCSFLLTDTNFINVDRRKGGQLSNALNLYHEFFDEQILTQASTEITVTNIADSASDRIAIADVSEVDELLDAEIFLPLKDALKKENVRTIEELKGLKLWAFMNQNNLYSISERQTVLSEVRRLLEPQVEDDPALLYELHCGSSVYYGETLAKAFLHFCETISNKYPLFFKSILDKRIGGTFAVKIRRSADNSSYIKMENPTCFIDSKLNKNEVISAVDWICQRCISEKGLISIKEPTITDVQSSCIEEHQTGGTIAKASESETAFDETPLLESLDVDERDAITNDAGECRLDFSSSCSLAYTKPISYSYNGKTVQCSTWNELYVNLIRDLFISHGALLMPDMRFGGSSRVDLGSKTGMTYPRAITNDVYLECNVSATGIVSKIHWVLDYCSVSTNDVIIFYRKRNSDSARSNEQTGMDDSNSHFSYDSATQEYTNADQELISKVEKLVLVADMNGITYDELYSALRTSMVAVKSLVANLKIVVEIKGRLYHEDAFIDWDDGAKQLCTITKKLMQKNNGYISAVQLYDYARSEMNMFLNDNDVNDERSVYEIAQHLFEKNAYGGYQYSFIGKTHISKKENEIGSNFDVICKFAEDQGGIFREDDLEEYLARVGIKSGNLRNQMRLNREPDFFFYESGVIITAKSMKMDVQWKKRVSSALNNLFNDADDHIILREIQSAWFETLPILPGHKRWTPLLLQYVLRFFGKELGARTIIAMESQSMDTLHAVVVKYDSPIQNFGDAVVAYLLDNEIEQRSFEAEELRQLLVNSGMIRGNELIWNMPKALAKDERFAWDAKGENVTVRL